MLVLLPGNQKFLDFWPSPVFGQSPYFGHQTKPDKMKPNTKKAWVWPSKVGWFFSLLLALAKAPLSILGQSRIKSNNTNKNRFGVLALKSGVATKPSPCFDQSPTFYPWPKPDKKIMGSS